jgi:hypothetical protein
LVGVDVGELLVAVAVGGGVTVAVGVGVRVGGLKASCDGAQADSRLRGSM